MADLLAYDEETTDADVRHGQITEFGAVRADMSFRPLERTLVRVRRLPYVVPAPGAMAVTGMDPSDLDDPSLPTEYEASGTMERVLSAPWGSERTYVTYNGPRFDDEMMRTTLHRNLRNPWFNNGKGCTRVDVLSLLQLVHAAAPGTVAVPVGADGKPSFKLEAVAPANGVPLRAHTAAGDAEATLALAEIVHRKARWAWDLAVANGNTAGVEARLSAAAASGDVLWVFTHFGKPEVVPCAVLGTDGKRKWILADRRVAASEFPMGAAAAAAGLYTKESPFRIVKAGGCPVLVDPGVAALVDSSAHASVLGHPPGFFKAKTPVSKPSPVALAAVGGLCSSTFEAHPDPTSEESIYDGFPGDRDKRSMTHFHRTESWAERAEIAFDDPRLRDFAARLVVAAVEEGLAEGIGSLALERAYAECASALSRPHAGNGARWATLAACLSENPGEAWEAWAGQAFPEDGPRRAGQPAGEQFELRL